MTLGNMFSAFRATQIPCHLWVPKHLQIERQIVLAPWLKPHGVLIGLIAR
jgi:hypothetical protein